MFELVVCALALGIFAGKAETSASTAESIINLLLRTVIALTLLFLVDARDRHLTLRPVQASVVVAALLLLTASFLGGQGMGETISRALFSLARNFALVVIYLMALRLTLNDGIHPFVSLGLLRGTYELVQGVGIVLDVRFAVSDLPLLTTSNTAFFVAAIVMVIVANRLVSFSADLYGDAGETLPSADSTDAQAQAARMAERCRQLGEQYNLTARETEIITLMCAGASKSRIADELVLSVNTVRWHTQNAYVKLGVHSKEELLRLVG